VPPRLLATVVAVRGAVPAILVWALAVYYIFSRLMVGSLRKELFVAPIRYNRMRYTATITLYGVAGVIAVMSCWA
jgi:hypothetical protein